MADIFISYASGDRSRAESLAKALEEQGWSVWWDRTIPPGKSFDQVIQEAITAAKCVVVLWSEKSIISDWVKEEATIGKRRQILVPAKIDTVDPPLGFGLIQAADLTDWKAEATHAGFVGFLNAISEIVGPAPLKIKEAEEKRAEEERIRKQEEEKKRREDEQSKAEEERQRLEEEKQRIAEKKQKRIEAENKAEEERKQREAEAKHKAEEEQKLRDIQAKIKQDKPKPEANAIAERKPPKSRKKSIVLGVGTVAVVIVLLVIGRYWWESQQQKTEFRLLMERVDVLVMDLEDKLAKTDRPEQIKKLNSIRYTLSTTVESYSELAAKVGLRSQLENAQNRLNQIQIQIENKEKELIAAQKANRLEPIEEGALHPPLDFTQMPNPKDWGLIIGIEHYAYYPSIKYAKNDALIVKKYFIKVLGVPEENIVSLLDSDATKARMEGYLRKYFPANLDQDSTLYVYFAGHGAAGMAKGEPYLIPYDGDIRFIDETAYKLVNFYKDLNNLKIQSVYVFLDACFSGAAARTAEMLVEGRPALIHLKDVSPPSGSIISLNAASSGQISNAHPEKEHGLFTYFLLRALNGEADSNGDGVISINEIYGYVKDNVTRVARRMGADQTPVLMPSPKKMKDVTISKVPR